MPSSSAVLRLCGVLALTSLSAISARPMHAGIDYARYLEEKADVEVELDEWLKKYEQDAERNGWIPQTEARSAEEVVEDRKQRFFMSKQLVSKLQKEQPDAEFSVDSPFSLMTEDEFATYVRNSYLQGNKTSLRGGGSQWGEEPTSDNAATDSDAAKNMEQSGLDVSSFMENLDFQSFKKSTEEFGNKLKGSRRLQQGVDWASHRCNAPIQSQGACGSCWAFAVVGATESAYCLNNGGQLTKFSEQQVTSCDRSSYGCHGGFPPNALRYIQQTGLCRGDQYPYTSGNGNAGQCNAGCQKTRIAIRQVARPSGESGLLSALQKQPVVVTVSAGNSVWKQYRGGVVSSCPSANLDHAVIAVGFDGSSVKIKNSWGTGWGEQGYMRLSRSGGGGTCGVYRDMSYPQM
ncbi:hypothetical protein PINS_up001419 [Pythium insidiosum]|nr:hypothetical protein PINS_up001417 [Pythium insidiosum]GLD92840.1 hypothetical protein PINS_up001419 [Pythium insidiosum]